MWTHTRNAFVACLLCLTIPIADASAEAVTTEARNLIDKLGNEAVTILQSGDPPDGREKRLESLLRNGFDFDFIGRFVLGQYWNRITPAQRDEYRQVFPDFVVQTYARQLANETVTGFEIKSTRETSDHDVIVETLIGRPKGSSLKYSWRVRGDKIVDVLVEEVSLLVSKRADFTSVVQRDGIDGLIASLKQKLQQS